MKKLTILLAFCLSVFAVHAQFTKTTVFSGLKYPVAFDISPDGRFFITEKGDGSNTSAQKSDILVYSSAGTLLGTFYDLSDSTDSDFERGVLGICLDADFANNHYVYVYYVHLYNSDERIRIVRFTENANVGINPLIILDQDVANNLAGNHFGGNLHMHASEPGVIYFTIGDLAQQTNPQQLTNPYGKFNRINTDGSIPTDNPFYDDGNPATGNDDRIWTYGHRNPFDFTFSPINDSLYSSENGLNTWDEANIIRKGHNYGWPTCEGFYLQNSTSTLCNTATEPPLTTWASPLPAVTGIFIYSGSVIPQFDTHMLIADNNNGKVYDCTLGNAPAYNTVTSNTYWMDLTTSGGLTTMKQGSDGCIYAMKGGYTTNGAIYRVCPTGLNIEEPESPLSQFAVAPNPFSSTATVEFTLKESKKIKLSLFDINGKRGITVYSKQADKGKNSIVINREELQLRAGMYFCNISSSDGEINKNIKVVIE